MEHSLRFQRPPHLFQLAKDSFFPEIDLHLLLTLFSRIEILLNGIFLAKRISRSKLHPNTQDMKPRKSVILNFSLFRID